MLKGLLFLGLLAFSSAAFARPIPLPGEVLSAPDLSAGEMFFDDFDFSGQAALPGCSGSIVSFGQSPASKAVLLTNGHCIGMLDSSPDAVIVGQPYQASVAAYVDLQNTVRARVTRILYGLMQPHDIAFLELDQTYGELAAKGVRSRLVSDKMAEVGTEIALASSYFAFVHICSVEAIIHEIHEDVWVNSNSYKYHCDSGHGTSGSPLVNLVTGEVVGVNYTGNDDGERCTFNNPCEVDEQGRITVEKGAGYGDQVYKVMTCLNGNREIDVTVAGCLLPAHP